MKTISEAQLATIFASLPENPRIVVSGNMSTPQGLLSIAEREIPQFRLWALNAHHVPTRDGITCETPFVGPGMRGVESLRYLPCRLSLVPQLFFSATPPDVVLLHTTPPSRGTVSLGLEVNVLPAAIEAARSRGALVIAQANRHMPHTYGDAIVPLDDIDYLVEREEDLPTGIPKVPDDISQEIGARVSDRIHDGATLQMGIGAVPDAVLAQLTTRRELRVWTEMFSDGVLALHKAGALDPDHPLVTSFVFGSPELYAWLDRNHAVRMVRTEKTNDPARIMRQRRMTSVNAALQVDLFGQANASRIQSRIYSGFGGQTDFIVGAMHAREGQAIIALRSWQPKINASTIVGRLSDPVTSFQQSAVVTEQGVAQIWGQSQREQAANLISHAAHPAARAELRQMAADLGLA